MYLTPFAIKKHLGDQQLFYIRALEFLQCSRILMKNVRLEFFFEGLLGSSTISLTILLRSLVVTAVHRHRTGEGSIPAGGRIVNDFFSTVPG